MRVGVHRWAVVFLLGLLLAGTAGNGWAARKKKGGGTDKAGFPPITEEERNLTEVPGEDNPAAVILFERGTVRVMDPSRSILSTTVQVETRIKILNEAGLDYAEWEIPHDEDLKLRKLKARTVLPDGSVHPVDEDGIFEREGRVKDVQYGITAIAFPAVKVGAILDYMYETSFENYSTPAWPFQDRVPTLHSEVTYTIPPVMGVQPWGRTTFNGKMESEMKRTGKGRTFKVWMDHLPGVPEEPFQFPMFDMSSVFELVLTEDRQARYKLFTDWDTTSERYRDIFYRSFLGKGRGASAKLAELTSGTADDRAKAEAIYRFVRDEIATRRVAGVSLTEDASIQKVLEEGEGDFAEKALLLQHMLEKAGLHARLVWVRTRYLGLQDMSVAIPSWFDRAVVQLQIDGETYFLDPSEKTYGFGAGRYGVEGMKALLFPGKGEKAKVITMPFSSPEENLRRAEMDLTVDDDGIASGAGTLLLTGHPARLKMKWKETPEETRDAWRNWLQTRLPGYEVSGVEVEEKIEEGEIHVAWKMAQPEEEVLGDEVSLAPSRPLGPVDSPFTLLTSQRQTPILFRFLDRDEVTWTIHWPEGWILESQPAPLEHANAVGSFSLALDTDLEARTLTVHRVMDRLKREVYPGREYGQLRSHYKKAGKSDAQQIVLALE